MKPFCTRAVPALTFVLGLLSLGARATETLLATSPEGEVTESEVRLWLGRSLDSQYATTATDYLSTGGLEQAIADIVLERRLAAMASNAGLAGKKEAAVQIESLKRDVLLNQVQRTLWEQVTVSDREVEEYYREHLDEFRSPERVKLHLYMVPLTGQNSAPAKARLEQLRKALVASENPEEIRVFQDVTSGIVSAKAGDFPPEVEERVFSGERGGLTDVFGRKNAWYLARILDHQTTKVASLEQVHARLRQQMHQKRFIDRQRNVEDELERTMPLVLHQESLALLTRERPGHLPNLPSSTVLAEVAGTSITLADVSGWMSRPLVVTQTGGMSIIDERQREEFAAGTLTRKEVEKAIREFANRLRLAHWAESLGYTDSPEFRMSFEQQKNAILAKALLRTLDTGTSPTEAELRAYFENEQFRFILPEQRSVTEIFLPLPRQAELPSNSAAYNQALLKRRQAMELILQQITSGTTISQALEGLGDLKQDVQVIDQGTEPEGPRGRVLDMAVRMLKAGEWSTVQQSRRGFHLFLVQNVIGARDRSFEEARQDVLRAIEAARRQDVQQKFIQQISREIAPIYYEEALRQFREKEAGDSGN